MEQEIPTAAKTILVVEDDKFFADLITRQFVAEGLHVVHATSGEDGLEKMAGCRPNLITVDLALPGISGLEFIAKLSQKPETKSIPFMVFSNSDEKEMRQESNDLGAVGYFVKAQFTPRELCEKVTEFLEKK